MLSLDRLRAVWLGYRASAACLRAHRARHAFPALVGLLLAFAGCSPPDNVEQLDLFPAQCGPYRRTADVARYTPANLHEYINGEAPYVVSFGFQGLATADYRRADEPATTVDVYDMGSAQNAFALFRSNANLEASPVEIGTEGAGGEGRIEFWQGRYYAVVSNPAAEDDAAVRDLARRLAADLPPTGRMPPCLGWLPAEGRVEASLRFTPQAYLGYEVLSSAASARYRLRRNARDDTGAGAGEGGQGPGQRPGEGGRAAEGTLFACRYESPDAAAAALAAFKDQVAAQSTLALLTDTEKASVGPDGFVAEEFVMGRLIVFRAGRFLAGMFPCSAAPADRSLLATLAAHLKALETR